MPPAASTGPKHMSDQLLVSLCARFFEEKEKTEHVVDWLEKDHGIKVPRNQIYAYLREANERGMFRLQVRQSARHQERLTKALGVEPDRIRVVDAAGAVATEQVALHGAEFALELIQQLGREQSHAKVRLGLGGGSALRRLSGQLATLLGQTRDIPPLAVHALSAGFDALAPQDAPISFLGRFEDFADELVGMFSPGVLETGELERMKQLPGIAGAFKSARKLDLVVTSLASAMDESGALNRFLAHGGHEDLEKCRRLLHAEAWVGDVLFEAYNRHEPITRELPVQPVSVFTLKELVALAKKKKVLLVAGPSPSGRTKTDALMPLLTSPKLRVWTHLVLDARTCEEAAERLDAAKG
jgi:DNA-binding transcriptional regulator LsrR (DeoR family)